MRLLGRKEYLASIFNDISFFYFLMYIFLGMNCKISRKQLLSFFSLQSLTLIDTNTIIKVENLIK